MSLTVYQLEHSPYCIPITAALTACGASYRVVNLKAFDRGAVIRKSAGKFYQVPFLIDGRRMICDDRHEDMDVARHVDRRYAGGRLFPKEKEGLQAILVPHIEGEVESATFKLCDIHYYADIPNLVERVHYLRHKERKFGRGCIDEWKRNAPALRARTETLLAPFDQMLRFSRFLLGEEPVYADFALYGIVGNYTFRGYNHLPPRFKSLAAWARRLKKFRYAQRSGG